MKTTPSLLRNLSGLLLLAIGGGLAALLVLRWFTGNQFAAVRLFDYFTPWFLIPILPSLILALTLRHYVLAGLIAAPLAYILLAYAPLFLPRAEAAAEGHGPFRVMSFNLWSHNSDLAASAGIILEERPDILLLQEVTPRMLQRLLPLLEELYPGQNAHSIHDPELLQAVITRFPILSSRSFPEMGQTLQARIAASGGEISVYNSHALREGNWTRRHRQVSALMDGPIRGERGAVLLAGDFNTTDRTETYRRMSRTLRNAHWEAGKGFGFTWPAFGTVRVLGIPVPPMVRIDHIFFSEHLAVYSAGTLGGAGGADHLPVVADFAFQPSVD